MTLTDTPGAPSVLRSTEPAPTLPPALAGLVDGGRLEPFPGSGDHGLVAGTAAVAGRPVVVYATDPAVRGGALTTLGCDLVVTAIDSAVAAGRPVVAVWHSGGAALDEGTASLDAVGAVFAAITRASGRVPQIALMDGPAAGGASYGAALNDVVVMTDTARMFVTGPLVVQKVTGAAVTMEDLGGPRVHSRESGVCHLHVADVAEARHRIGTLLTVLAPTATVSAISSAGPRPDPSRHVPDSPRQVYDMRLVVDDLVDGGPDGGVELHATWAPNVHTRLASIAGQPVGVLANQPLHKAGCLDATAGDKAARFVRLCDAWGIPLLVLVDVPGYLPGLDEERSGVLRRGAKLLHAFAAASTPTMTVLVRKAFGGAYIAMNSASLGASRVVAWPGVDAGVMSPESSVEILHRRELTALDEPAAAERRAELLTYYLDRRPTAESLVASGAVDAVIDPARTVAEVRRWLATTPRVEPGRITNIPL